MNLTRPLLATLLLGACGTTSVIEESRELAFQGQYQRAYSLLDDLRAEALLRDGPVDPALEQAWRDARLTWLVERGRALLFADYNDEALVAAAAVLVLDPENEEARYLSRRAVEKKAAAAVAEGERLLNERQLEPALAAFLEAERIQPGLPAAIEGQDAVRDQVAKLTERAQQQFLEAVRKLPEFRYVEVRWHSSNALVDDPTRRDAEEIRLRARREIAQATMDRGVQNRRDGQFGAALIQFRAAKELDETLPGIDQAIADMERELEAGELAAKAQMHMRRHEFEDARAKLGEAFQLSELLRGTITELMIENRHMEGERDYQMARDFEYQGLKQQALEAYVALSAKWPDGLEDEKARIEALQVDITSAKKEWELAVTAEKAGRLAEALEHFIASQRFYAKLHDAEKRIASLRKRLAEAKGEGASATGEQAAKAKEPAAGGGGS